jgi:hypothetical protein
MRITGKEGILFGRTSYQKKKQSGIEKVFKGIGFQSETYF